jgi:hypothetical protein
MRLQPGEALNFFSFPSFLRGFTLSLFRRLPSFSLFPSPFLQHLQTLTNCDLCIKHLSRETRLGDQVTSETQSSTGPTEQNHLLLSIDPFYLDRQNCDPDYFVAQSSNSLPVQDHNVDEVSPAEAVFSQPVLPAAENTSHSLEPHGSISHPVPPHAPAHSEEPPESSFLCDLCPQKGFRRRGDLKYGPPTPASPLTS